MSVIALSIAEESQPKLQETQQGWFQWTSEELTRIASIRTIQSLLERHQAAQKAGIEHIVILESGKSKLLPKLDKDINVIFRNQAPFEVVNLLCQPDFDMLSAWKKICQGQKIKNKAFKNRMLSTKYGLTFNSWLNRLHEEDLTDYLPASNRIFSSNEFTYVGIEEGALVFALTTFPAAWLSLRAGQKAQFAGAFTKGPKLKLFFGRGRDWDKLDDRFWAKWIKNFRIPKNELVRAGIIQAAPARIIVWGPVFASIVVAVLVIPPLIHQERQYEFFPSSYRGTSNSLMFLIYSKGLKGDPSHHIDEKWLLFWELGDWTKSLDTGCNQEIQHFDFQNKKERATELAQKFKDYEEVVNHLKDMENKLSQNDLKRHVLCETLAEKSRHIFTHLYSLRSQ
ncbi:membrane protein [Candidatus Thiomargarita nelsonii]|uniref:Membrane protein n=1 Tax=Candidatus Thiomargarita nelsonii TaxID=1003181 RepID=A0A0A6P0Y2_9GAMM|nr:membrane protein [Candidatus Thiomargarita nelsonii]